MVLQGYYAMGKTPIKHTLAGYIIKKTDTEGYRSGKLTGEKHFNKITEMMEFVGGRRKLIDQARFIENNTQAGHDGKIRISWIQVNSDIKKLIVMSAAYRSCVGLRVLRIQEQNS